MSNTRKLRRLGRSSGQVQRGRGDWGKTRSQQPVSTRGMTMQEVSAMLDKTRKADIVKSARKLFSDKLKEN